MSGTEKCPLICPACYSQGCLITTSQYGHHIACVDCGMAGPGKRTKAEAVESWQLFSINLRMKKIEDIIEKIVSIMPEK